MTILTLGDKRAANKHAVKMVLLLDLLGKLKLERDFSRYNYLGLDSARVNGVDDAANFRTVRVTNNRGWV